MACGAVVCIIDQLVSANINALRVTSIGLAAVILHRPAIAALASP